MTRFGIDAGVLPRIAAGEIDLDPEHQLVGAGDLRSQVGFIDDKWLPVRDIYVAPALTTSSARA